MFFFIKKFFETKFFLKQITITFFKMALFSLSYLKWTLIIFYFVPFLVIFLRNVHFHRKFLPKCFFFIKKNSFFKSAFFDRVLFFDKLPFFYKNLKKFHKKGIPSVYKHWQYCNNARLQDRKSENICHRELELKTFEIFS